MLTTDDFLKMAHKKPFSETLAALPHFARGLPSGDQLRSVGVATVFRELLVRANVISTGIAMWNSAIAKVGFTLIRAQRSPPPATHSLPHCTHTIFHAN